TLTSDGIAQDEPLQDPGSGRTCPDASIGGDRKALLWAERAATKDDRVYHVSFTAADGQGGECRSAVRCVAHMTGDVLQTASIRGRCSTRLDRAFFERVPRLRPVLLLLLSSL